MYNNTVKYFKRIGDRAGAYVLVVLSQHTVHTENPVIVLKIAKI